MRAAFPHNPSHEFQVTHSKFRIPNSKGLSHREEPSAAARTERGVERDSEIETQQHDRGLHAHAQTGSGRQLAEGDIFQTQAFRVGSGYAIQFHPEVTHAMMCRWTTRGAARMELPGTKQRHEHFADRPVYDHGIRAWLAEFLDHWLALGQRQLAAAE